MSMEVANIILFYILAAAVGVFSILAVTARRIFRAVTYMLFVLIATAGLYLMLNYHFLAAVQISVYAGGVVVLFIFAVMLTNPRGEQVETRDKMRSLLGLGIAAVGVALTLFTVFTHKFGYVGRELIVGDTEIDTQAIGHAMVGTEKYQYILPFEVLGMLLLACIIGGVLIARKR